MEQTVTPRIALDNAPGQTRTWQFALGEAFFSQLEWDNVLGGDVVAEAEVGRNGDADFRVKLSVEGHVVVACDRCLDELQLPVAVSDAFTLTSDADLATERDDLRHIDARATSYDLADDIRAAVELSLPLRRVHAEGECNPDMLSYVRGEAED